MADRPAQICQLEKGKLIDTQQGFADTFNWVAQSVANLQGGQNCEVSWTLPDHPTIDVNVGDEGEGGGGGITNAVYDVTQETRDEKDGLLITYTDDREESFIPFPNVSSDVSGTYVTDLNRYYYSNNLTVNFSDGTSKNVSLPTAISAVSRGKSWAQHEDVLSARFTNGTTSQVDLGITLSGTTPNYNSSPLTEFKFNAKRDSNVVIDVRGYEIDVGVYYI